MELQFESLKFISHTLVRSLRSHNLISHFGVCFFEAETCQKLRWGSCHTEMQINVDRLLTEPGQDAYSIALFDWWRRGADVLKLIGCCFYFGGIRWRAYWWRKFRERLKYQNSDSWNIILTVDWWYLPITSWMFCSQFVLTQNFNRLHLSINGKVFLGI